MKKKSSAAIPVHRLDARTSIGIELYYQHHSVFTDSPLLTEVHRDDYYIFVIQQSGSCRMMVDFEEMKVKGCVAFYLLPGQVHHYISSTKLTGWFMAIDPSLISTELRGFFNEQVIDKKPMAMDKASAAELSACAFLLHDQLKRQRSYFWVTIINQLATTFIAMMANYYQKRQPSAKILRINRSKNILLMILFLAKKYYMILRSPSQS